VVGGLAGRGGRAIVNPGRSDEREIAALSDGTILKRGDVFRIETVGGGGWGHPFDREPEAVRADVLGRMVSLASARDDYGVVLTGDDLRIDLDATRELRSARAAREKEAAAA
jgi:N-methylhydantoinase B